MELYRCSKRDSYLILIPKRRFGHVLATTEPLGASDRTMFSQLAQRCVLQKRTDVLGSQDACRR